MRFVAKFVQFTQLLAKSIKIRIIIILPKAFLILMALFFRRSMVFKTKSIFCFSSYLYSWAAPGTFRLEILCVFQSFAVIKCSLGFPWELLCGPYEVHYRFPNTGLEYPIWDFLYSLSAVEATNICCCQLIHNSKFFGLIPVFNKVRSQMLGLQLHILHTSFYRPMFFGVFEDI